MTKSISWLKPAKPPSLL